MKRAIRLQFLCFLLIFGLSRTYAGTYYTITSGSWGSTSVWQNGQIPPLAGTDSIYVLHNVMYNVALNLPSSTYLRIDTAGSLCGHERFIVQSGSRIDNYGDLYADSLYINGGMVHNYGYILLSNMAVIGNGGSLVNSGSMQIGGTFLCSEKPGGEAEFGNMNAVIGFFPQPGVNGEEIHCDLKGVNGNCELRIFSLTGELVEETGMNGDNGFYLNGMSAGIYLVVVRQEGEIVGYGKLIVVE